MRLMRVRRLVALLFVIAACIRSARVHRAAVRARPVVRHSCRGDAGHGAPRRRPRHDARQRARDRDPDRARSDARAGLRTRGRTRARRCSSSGPASVRHRRAAARAPGPAPLRQRHRRRHARHPGALALRDRAGDHRRDRAGRGVARRSKPALAPDQPVGADGHQLQRRAVGRRRGTAVAGGRVAYVFSFGGHDDLPRVLRYLCTGRRAAARRRTRSWARRRSRITDFVLAAARLRRRGDAARRSPIASCRRRRSSGCARRSGAFSSASALDGGVDKAARRARIRGAARSCARTLPEPSATLLRYVNERDVVHLGAAAAPARRLDERRPMRCRSRSHRSRRRRCFCCTARRQRHPGGRVGVSGEDLRGHAPVRLLLSGLISHAEADRPMHVGDVMKLAGFWGDLLSR